MKPLVLLHGALGAASQLDTLADALRPHFPVHAKEFEGHGGTPPSGEPWRMERFARDVAAFLDAIGADRAYVFGYSMGGYVAVQLAADCPERVAGVATLGTKYRWDPATAAREVARLDPVLIRQKVPHFADALAARHERAGGWEGVLARTASLLRRLGDAPLLTDDRLATIAVPVHLIVGERDATVTVEESDAIARALPAGSLTVLPETPHPIEQVDVATLVRVLTDRFLNPPSPDAAAAPRTPRSQRSSRG